MKNTRNAQLVTTKLMTEYGRVVIPAEVRRTCHMHNGTPVDILILNGCIVLRAAKPPDMGRRRRTRTVYRRPSDG